MGQYACEDWKIDVVETYTSAARFAMHYLHVYLSSGNFDITTGNAASNDRVIGYMVWDYGCAFSGYHVHESHVNIVRAALNNLYPNGDCCDPSPCSSYYNHLHADATRWFWWEEGQ